ncbi:MAG: ankyrin repeat domain-containing protein [Candidatus Brocadiia bacterium]
MTDGEQRPWRVWILGVFFFALGLAMVGAAVLALRGYAEVAQGPPALSTVLWQVILPAVNLLIGIFVQVTAVEFVRLRAWARRALEVMTWLYLGYVFVLFPAFWLVNRALMLRRAGEATVARNGLDLRAFVAAWDVAAITQGAICALILFVLRGRTVRDAVRRRRSGPAALAGVVAAVLVISGTVTVVGLTRRREPFPGAQRAEPADTDALRDRLHAGDGPSRDEIRELLMDAIDNGRAGAVRLLAERGPDLNEEPAWMELPLHRAVKAGRADIVQLLLESGADPNAESGRRIPLSLAWEAGRAAIVRRLLEAGASVRGEKADDNPLHRAAWSGCVECIELLVAAGADLNARTELGAAALHAAAQSGRVEAAEALIDAGAAVRLADQNGQTPLHTALLWGNIDVAELLLRSGADVHAKNDDGWTPLHLAAAGGAAEVAGALVKQRADPGVTDRKGRTPADLAEQHGHKDLSAWLRSRRHGPRPDVEPESTGQNEKGQDP